MFTCSLTHMFACSSDPAYICPNLCKCFYFAWKRECVGVCLCVYTYTSFFLLVYVCFIVYQPMSVYTEATLNISSSSFPNLTPSHSTPPSPFSISFPSLRDNSNESLAKFLDEYFPQSRECCQYQSVFHAVYEKMTKRSWTWVVNRGVWWFDTRMEKSQ